MPCRAVAIDLGASSARFALGELNSESKIQNPKSKINFQIIEQVPHSPLEWNGHEVWDIDLLLSFCQKALKFAKENGAESIGIDTWGVDHGFIGPDGKLIQPPICYRDHSHVAMFEKMKEHRPWLYAQTGIQHQPFNTIYQLLARKEEQPELFREGYKWLLLPDLLLYLLGGEPGYERSIATTTQLTNNKGEWNPKVFDRFGLPMPQLPITKPNVAGEIDGVRLTRVGGHDTACAVEGMGLRYERDKKIVFVNLGTWALVGKVKDDPDHTTWAEENNLTNERTPWNDIRLLTNIPGFFILNGIHNDLNLEISVGEWLESADLSRNERINVFDPEFYAPESMLDAVAKQIGKSDFSPEEWAGIGLWSLVETITERARLLGAWEIRIAGGGSKCRKLCQLLANVANVPVRVAPNEATVLGNLATQFTFWWDINCWETGALERFKTTIVEEYLPQL